MMRIWELDLTAVVRRERGPDWNSASSRARISASVISALGFSVAIFYTFTVVTTGKYGERRTKRKSEIVKFFEYSIDT
jgi:hypothetical protein